MIRTNIKKQLTLNQKEYDLLKTKKDLSNFNIIINNDTKNILVEKTRKYQLGDKIVKFNHLEEV
jgi:hypothetical protein